MSAPAADKTPPTVGKRTGFRSKFHGRPGSLAVTNALTFKSNQSVFDPKVDISDAVADRKKEVILSLQPRSLVGGRPAWNASSQTPDQLAVGRKARVRQLSEYQSLKLQYNYRAEVLPRDHKDSIVVPRCDKFHMDQTTLLSSKERARVVRKPPVLSSTAEIPVHPKLAQARAWDNSTQACGTAGTVSPKREFPVCESTEKSFRSRKPKRPDPQRYVSPVQHQKLISERTRREKEEARQREREAKEREELTRQIKLELY